MLQIPWTVVFAKERQSFTHPSEYVAKELYGSIEQKAMLEQANQYATHVGYASVVCIIKGSHAGGFYANR